MRREDAIILLKRRMKARREGDRTKLNEIDRKISAAVVNKTWPEIRTDSAPNNARPISKAPTESETDPEGRYIKLPAKDWEA